MRELWGPFLFGVGLFSLLIISTAVMQDALKFVVKYNQPPAIFFTLVGYAMPEFIILSIPMGVLLGTLLSVGRLNTDNEIIALRACGISIYRVLAPYFVVGVLLSCATFLGNEIVVPFCSIRVTELKQSIISGERGLGQKLNYSRAVYNQHAHDYQLVLIGEGLGDTALGGIARRLGERPSLRAKPLLKGLVDGSAGQETSEAASTADQGSAAESRSGKTQRFHWPFYTQDQQLEWVLIAGEVEDNTLLDVTLFYFDPRDKYDSFMVEAERAVWDGHTWKFFEMSQFKLHRRGSQEEQLRTTAKWSSVGPNFSILPETLRLSQKKAEDLNILQLARVIKDKVAGGSAPASEIRDLQTSLHFKVTIPLTPLFFIIMALPMAIMPQRSSRAMGMGLSLLTVLVYYSMYVICQKMGVAGVLPPAAAAWVPNSVLFATGVILLRLREQN